MSLKLFFVPFFSCFCLLVSAQQIDTLENKLIITGQAFDESGNYKSDLLVVNERTYTGFFGEIDGTFKLYCDRNDTLVFGAIGYLSQKFCFADSVPKKQYDIKIYLQELEYDIGLVEIIAPRDLAQIQKDIQELGYDEKDYRVSGINAITSPITFLYESFSRLEQSKRKVAELENAGRRRALLKELFHKYVDFEIIELSNEEFDEFIDFLNISDRFLQSCTQYEFILFTKDRFTDFKSLRRKRGLQPEDYDYHKD